MINYKDIKNYMDTRNIEITKSQLSFALLTSIGLDKYDAYNIAIIGNNEVNKKGLNSSDFENKCKNECDILCSQNDMTQLIAYLKDKYEYQINDAAINCEEVEVTPKMLKNLLGRIIKRSSDNLENTSYSDLIRVVSQYVKQFDMEDIDDVNFKKHFIQIFPSFNFVCDTCNHEGDSVLGVDFICKNCGRHYHWSEEDKRFY